MKNKDLSIIKRTIKKIKEKNLDTAIILLESIIDHYEK